MPSYRIDPIKGIVFGRSDKPVGYKDRDGYLVLSSNRKYVGTCHRLIWESVHGPIPHGMQINHINGIKADNRIANLELVTPSQNIRHAFRTGLSSAVGERNNRAILTAGTVRAARSAVAGGESYGQVARRLGVAIATLRHAVNRRSWRSVA